MEGKQDCVAAGEVGRHCGGQAEGYRIVSLRTIWLDLVIK